MPKRKWIAGKSTTSKGPAVARPAHKRDDDPVAGQVDGVAVALVDGRHAAAGERTVERVAGAFAFQGHDHAVRAVEIAEHGVGKLAIDFDVLFAANRVA